MIVSDVKVPVEYTEEQLCSAIRKAAKKKELRIRSVTILRRSIDARKKPELFYVMKLLVNETLKPYRESRTRAELTGRTVVCGAGPAGLFAAMTLAEAGEQVLLLERGEPVEKRKESVEEFFRTGVLNTASNVQFGEGGAGTFSDGKLNTLTIDSSGRNRRVLERFVAAGAPEEILYDARPHIGTDKLLDIVRNFREIIRKNGGDVRFNATLTDIRLSGDRITGVVVNGREEIPCERLILSPGHSARDTIRMLYDHGLPMEAKSFAVGVRMEHPQKMITMDQYGTLEYRSLGAAPYRLAVKTSGGRGVYSFCMCPGGYVVNASSEEGRLCINGMSNSARDGENANSAVIVQVDPEDYGSTGPLSGIEFQRKLEEKAFEAAEGRIPVQCYGDFVRDRVSTEFGEIRPAMKGQYGFGDLRKILPAPVTEALLEAVPRFGRMIRGFDRPDALMSAVEARTSSPVRILRGEDGQSEIRGIYPAGEGAGYAGGIMSAAMDGLRTAEKILYQEQDTENEGREDQADQ